MSSRKTALVHESLEPLILVIRNQRVILDAHLARLYGVATKAFNQPSNATSSVSFKTLPFN